MSCQKAFFHFLLIVFHSLPIIISTNSSDIEYEILPLIRVYKNGTIERFFGSGFVPASVDPRTGVQSKDITVLSIVTPLSETNISARLFLPKSASTSRKIPLLVYYHGGGFLAASAFAPEYHNHLNSLVAEANVVVLSINYRLAPEDPLPIGYEDSWNALKWVFSRCDEPWIKDYVDFRHVYLGGDSAGGNVAHSVAIRAGIEKTNLVAVKGMFLNCPYFWGEKPLGNEDSSSRTVERAGIEDIWPRAYPNSTGFDDPSVNPGMDTNMKTLGVKRVLVYNAERDILKYRGFYYAKVLRKSGWSGVVEVVEVKGEEHNFVVLSPDKPESLKMVTQLASFLNQGDK